MPLQRWVRYEWISNEYWGDNQYITITVLILQKSYYTPFLTFAPQMAKITVILPYLYRAVPFKVWGLFLHLRLCFLIDADFEISYVHSIL